jgi:hypothetical protein
MLFVALCASAALLGARFARAPDLQSSVGERLEAGCLT